MPIKKLLILIFISNVCYSQQSVQDYIESIAASGERNLMDLMEEFNYYKSNPISINTVTKEELLNLSFLNIIQVEEIIDYRRNNNGFVDIRELQLLQSITSDDMIILYHLFKIQPNQKISTQKHRIDQIIRIGSTTNKIKGDIEPINRPHFLFRNKTSINNNLSFGLTLQKDAGESWVNQETLTDFVSFSVQIKPNLKYINQVNIGDYTLNIGEGLCFWNGFALGKALQFGSSKKGKTLNSYHGADEFNFLKGSAMNIKYGKFSLAPFLSIKRLDASISENNVYAIRTDGTHITNSQISGKKALQENILGGQLSYNSQKIQLGIYSSYWNYSIPFKHSDPSKTRLSTTQKQFKSGVHWKYRINKTEWFGEFSINENLYSTTITGMRIQLSPNIRWTSSYRNYSKGYHSHYANSFGEKSYTSNEKGFYNSLEWQITSKTSIKGYYDLYNFPGYSYNEEHSTKGQDSFLEIRQLINSSNFSLRLKHEQRTQKHISSTTRMRLQFELPTNSLKLVYRAEGSIHEGKTGWLFFQDIRGRIKRFNTTFRLAYFNTPDFGTAVYAYQPNVLYAFQTKAYFNEGIQLLLNIGKRLSQNFKVGIQLAQLTYLNQKSVGSNHFETQGSNQTTINFQVQLML